MGKKPQKLRILIFEKSTTTKKQLINTISERIDQIDSCRETSTFVRKAEKNTYNIIFVSSERIRQNKDVIIAAIKSLLNKFPTIQIIILAEQNDMTITMESIKAGSYQYARIPVPNHELVLLINTVLETKPSNIEEGEPNSYKDGLFEIVGSSHPMQIVYEQINQAASSEIPVLILGETGTGKDLVAQTIHKLSQNKEEPYHPVNLGALPSELIASELFGHEKGAYTGATDQHIGVFELAGNGTVFLDEIDSIDEKVQISLLRLLENHKFKRLGGRKYISTHSRLMAASNENIEELVANKGFRSDLFYRLDVFRITVPTLKQRKSDIPLLASEFIAKYSRIYNKRIASIDNGALDALMNSDWPGNVRELKNVIQRSVLVCKSDVITIEDLPERFLHGTENNKFFKISIGTELKDVEREVLLQTLAFCNGNKKETAEKLGISRRAIYNKIKRLNIDVH